MHPDIKSLLERQIEEANAKLVNYNNAVDKLQADLTNELVRQKRALDYVATLKQALAQDKPVAAKKA